MAALPQGLVCSLDVQAQGSNLAGSSLVDQAGLSLVPNDTLQEDMGCHSLSQIFKGIAAPVIETPPPTDVDRANPLELRLQSQSPSSRPITSSTSLIWWDQRRRLTTKLSSSMCPCSKGR
jgi:hypothetical protein